MPAPALVTDIATSPTRRTRTASTRRTAPLASYRDRITHLAERIRGTDDVSMIIEAIDQALAETRALRDREELVAARRKVAEAERSIETLRGELEQVKALLHQDPLTGVLNRRGLDEAFRREASRSDRQQSSLCVALLDLDNFKALNDTHGHAAGDAALSAVAAVARGTLRPNDQVGRFGGEEFLVLLPDTALRESAAVMARVKRDLARRAIDGLPAGMTVTFSAGVAQRAPGETLEHLVIRTDEALYRAKRAGKNRVALARTAAER